MICETCGKQIDSFLIDTFQYDGSDSFISYAIEECGQEAICVDVSPDWVGYELDDEEYLDLIKCPHCKHFPLKNQEVLTYEIIRLVMFKTDEKKDIVEKGQTVFFVDCGNPVPLEVVDINTACGIISCDNFRHTQHYSFPYDALGKTLWKSLSEVENSMKGKSEK